MPEEKQAQRIRVKKRIRVKERFRTSKKVMGLTARTCLKQAKKGLNWTMFVAVFLAVAWVLLGVFASGRYLRRK